MVADVGAGKKQVGKGVVDSGEEYGDINEKDLEGEEKLEKLDERALIIFPIFFTIFNLGFWCNYLLKDTM